MKDPTSLSPPARSAALASEARSRHLRHDPVGGIVALAQLGTTITGVILAALAVWGTTDNLALFVVVSYALFFCAAIGSGISAAAHAWFDIIRPAPIANAALLLIVAFVILSSVFGPSFTNMLTDLLASVANHTVRQAP